MRVNVAMVVLGWLAVLVGLWWVSMPLAVIVGGASLVGAGLMREDGTDGPAGRPTDQA